MRPSDVETMGHQAVAHLLSGSTDSVDGWMHVYSLDTRGSSLHTLGQSLRGLEGNAIRNMCTVDRFKYDL